MNKSSPSNSRPKSDRSASATTPSISEILGAVTTLPGESADLYQQGLDALIKELDAQTVLQVYLAEKIFQCLWWMHRYEVQKNGVILNSMVDLLTEYNTPKNQRYAITELLRAQLWGKSPLKKHIEAHGHSPESLLAQAISRKSNEIQQFDQLIALRVKTLAQLQQSYEALVNRSIMRERLKLQNELLKRDLQAIDIPAVESLTSENKLDDQSQATSSQ